MKDQEFRHFYDTLMGMKSESMAYTFWCAGWDAAQQANQQSEAQYEISYPQNLS